MSSAAYAFQHDIEPANDQHGTCHQSATAARLFSAQELRRLQILARRLAPAGVDADDLLHDGLERALRNLHHFQEGSNLYAWMRTILSRLAVDRVRAHQRRRSDGLDVDSLPAPECAEREEEAWADLGMDDVRAAAEDLPEGMRRAFEMATFEGLPYDEIARRLEVSPGTVGSRLLRSRLRVRALLQERLERRHAPLPFPSLARVAAEAAR